MLRWKPLSILTLLLAGLICLAYSTTTLTGAVIGIATITSPLSLVGCGIVIVALVMFVWSGEQKSLEDLATEHHWNLYPIGFLSPEIDRDIQYLYDPTLTKPEELRYERTALQTTIEQVITGGDIILPYIPREDKMLQRRFRKQETINKRQTYQEQFYEGHAAKGGRIIDAKTHITNGQLHHFNMPADGNYIWVVDDLGNFILANRDIMQHDMYQMPANTGSTQQKPDIRKTILPHSTLARGRHVYGAGEVIIKNGYIVTFNSDSGHYFKEKPDEGGPPEPATFNKQGVNVFKTFAELYSWKMAPEGAPVKSKHYFATAS